MSNSQEQSLNEDLVFLPVVYTSPGFLHCEKERQGIETLLSAGPESFYTSIALEHSDSFISPEEVNQIAGWAQDYHFNHLQGQREENGMEGSSEIMDFCSTYFPCHTDPPTPSLELGWPEKRTCVPTGSIAVHTSPPAAGEPSVREIIRWHLQTASQVIALVTDRLTDRSIIADLHKTASRGVPIYIILNQRSTEENFTLSRLMHPNIRVRVLQGRTFCSRRGRMVVGEMKNKFLLVDLETVIHGSYSLTWTDAHLHRQLITVLRGPVVDSFDREFRMLFAASFPVPEKWRATGTSQEMIHQIESISDPWLKNKLYLESKVNKPPSPPVDSFLDWEEMGVFQRHSSFHPLSQHEVVANEMLLQNNTLFDENTLIMDNFTYNGNQFLDMKRVEARQLSSERNNNLDDRTTMRLHGKTKEPTQRKRSSKREPILEEINIDETSSPVDKAPSKRPIILRVPQYENLSPLSDIMRKVNTQLSPSGLFNRGSKAALSQMSQSMMELSVVNADTNPGVPEPRFKATPFRPGHMTPAYALMKNRNDDMKSVLHRPPKTSLIKEGLTPPHNWRKPLKEREVKK
ncbi:protein FAM83D-B isoform X2 [Channa argus]|uniref:protein FAM83D-B isoform X2 n=1 Tax=Channa argus TaxID=215402 RepID=UPI0029440BE5|nr:hypothetical protein Q8A73_005790 [Channa argus]